MKYAQHGEFSLHWQGDVLVARYTGTWNELASTNLHATAKQMWAAGLPAPAWGLLSDVREWGGGTPQALELWWEFFEDCVQHGLLAVSDVVPSPMLKLVLSPLAKRASALAHYHRGDNIEDALQWLASQGLRTG
ncbi:hypothetical protein [Rhodoferax aquaticus]|uniref:STAS/SEC14 domain-containing protein n=1 Tax=Rhodoferax aquaticus TaxID=2527691 RepID=A0A515EJG1_9BURK|nr:hypothetical protein [Rhodoferax aquaticus]QDL52807.1 hypothetical protein EXZ61_00670 [Rhodoferax aquaticus]